LPRPALPLLALSAAALALAGCSSDSGSGAQADPSSAVSSAASPSPSSTVKVPAAQKLTDQGSKLAFGDAGTVIFESTQSKGSVLRLTVKSVQRGRLSDFKGFILDDTYKKNASYYYAKVRVRNVGDGDVGGVGVPLWGVNAANTLLPAVNFTTDFARCPSRPLPAKFGPGAVLNTCLVYLSPDKGALRSVSYRPSQEFNPITWTGDIQPPAQVKKVQKKAQKKAQKKKG
jgi:hypothetical protein